MLKLTQCNSSTLLNLMEISFEEGAGLVEQYGAIDKKYQDFASLCMSLVMAATVIFSLFCCMELASLWSKGGTEEREVQKANLLNDPEFVPFRHHKLQHGTIQCDVPPSKRA